MKEHECRICGFSDEGALVSRGVRPLTRQIYCLVCYEILKTCLEGSLAIWSETLMKWLYVLDVGV